VERGERNVTLSTLELIAGALGVSVPELLTEDSIKNSTKVYENTFNRLALRLGFWF